MSEYINAILAEREAEKQRQRAEKAERELAKARAALRKIADFPAARGWPLRDMARAVLPNGGRDE